MATLRAVAGRSERGQAIIEMALTLPLLLLIVLGVFDFGLMFQKYEVVTNAAREGGRVGVLPDYTPALAQQRALDYLAVGGMNGTVRGSIASCAGPFATGQRCVSAVVSDTVITGSVPAKTVKQITVTATYDYTYQFVGPIMNLFGGTLGTSRLTAVTTMRLENN
jgi:Flp pilus assembly protein TadG